MPDVITCPGCQRKLRLPEGCHGRQTQCPACATRFFPAPEPPPAEVFVAQLADPVPETPPPSRRPDRPPLEDAPSPWAAAVKGNAAPRVRRQGLPWWGTLLIVLGVLAAVGGFVGVLSMTLRLRPQPAAAPNPFRVPEDAGQRRQEVEQAFHNQKPLAPDEIAREVKPLFDGLGAAFQAADGPRIMDHFNLERLLEEMAAQNGLPAVQRGAFLQGFRAGMEQTLAQQAPNFNWLDSEIRHVKKLAGNEAVVIVRHRTADGQSLKMRWWVTKRQGTWQVFDYEELTTGLRVTTVMGPIKDIDPGRMNAIGQGLKVLQEALLDLAQRQDADGAEKKLRQIAAVQFPPKIEALRSMTTGIIQLHRNQVQEALASFDKAHGLHPDMVLLDLLRGRAYNHLGQWAKALKHLEAYRKLLGEDEDVCQQLGEALAGLRRFPEACAAYRKALDFAPKDADSFLGLLQALGPDDRREDLAARFARLDNRAENFATFAEECKGDRDGASLTILATAMRRLDPRSAAPPYYLALCRAWEGQADEAVAQFRAALAKQPDADKRRDYTTGFCEAMAQAGTAVEAYAAAPDPKEAFRMLASRLHKRQEGGELRQLIAAHAQKVPDDRLLPFYRGAVHVWDGQYRKGDAAFTVGLRQAPDQYTVDTFRAGRVLARFHTGQALSAYAAIKPRAETFRQLARLCLQDKPDQLEALLDAHARAVPNDADLPRYRCLLRVKQGRIAEAFALLKVALAKQPNDAGRMSVENEFFGTVVAAGKAVEAYRAAPDAGRAFESLASQFEDDGRWDDLRPLLEAHRKGHPQDVWVSYYTGLLHVQEKAWDKAARVLGEGWKKAPDKLRDQFRWPYIEAEYQAGRGLHVYEKVGPRNVTFTQLANLMAGDKKWAEVEMLIAAHRRHAGADPELFFQEARAKVYRGKTAEAVALLGKAYRAQKEEWRRSGYVGMFVTAMREMGKGLEGYRAAPDPSAAFETLAGWLLREKKTEELARLIAEHGRRHPGDPLFSLYDGELCLLQGNAQGAERILAAAMPKVPRRLQFRIHQALLRARVRAGRAVAAYQERGRGKASFEEVASTCFQAQDSRQLEALIAAHRRRRPDDFSLVLWEIKARWLARDYAAAVKQMTEHHDDVFAPARYRWEFEAFLVRGLVRLKRYPEAVREAEAVVKGRFGNRLLLVLARAAQGDVKQTIAAVTAAGAGQQRQDFVTRCYADEDLGPLLRGKGFEAFRTAFPERKMASP